MPTFWMLVGLAIAYLLGSVPSGYWLCKALKGVDIRTQGSGNIGATNVKRVFGPGLGNAVLILDMSKGLAAVFLGAWIFYAPEGPMSLDLYKIACAVAAVCGHNWPVFLGFKGGKGVATSAGALIGLAPLLFAISLAVWVAAAKFSRYVSVASMSAALAFCLLTFLGNYSAEMRIFAMIMAGMLVLRHKANIARLMNGTEPKMGSK